MSAFVREALANAANKVDGITIHPYYTQTTDPGSGIVTLARIAYPNKFGGMVTWQVLILLPQDLATAEKYLESKVPSVVAELGPEMTVTSVTPQEVVFDTGVKLPCAVIEGTREED